MNWRDVDALISNQPHRSLWHGGDHYMLGGVMPSRRGELFDVNGQECMLVERVGTLLTYVELPPEARTQSPAAGDEAGPEGQEKSAAPMTIVI